MHRWVAPVIAVWFCATPANAGEDEVEDEVEVEVEHATEIHAFVTLTGMVTSDNNYLAFTERGTFEAFEAGLNIQRPLTDQLRVGLQLVVLDLGPRGDYKPLLDWANLDYRWRDWLGVRAGRVKIPIGLYNEIIDIDAARPTALLPSSVYLPTNRQISFAHTGVELYGFRRLGRAGALDYRLYGGALHVAEPEATETLPDIVGGRVMWETPVQGLRVGGSVVQARLYAEAPVAGMPGVRGSALFRVREWIASLEYAAGPLLFAAEYGRQGNLIKAGELVALESRGELGYVLAAYRARPWLQAASYYSMSYPDMRVRVGKAARHVDAAFTLRFDINPHWLVKVEGHAMRGTAALEPALNDDLAQTQLANKWYLGLVRTTVIF